MVFFAAVFVYREGAAGSENAADIPRVDGGGGSEDLEADMRTELYMRGIANWLAYLVLLVPFVETLARLKARLSKLV